MLSTNMMKKVSDAAVVTSRLPLPLPSMSSGNSTMSGLALNGLSCFITPDLARDRMMSSLWSVTVS